MGTLASSALQKKYAPKLVPDREMRELARESDVEQAREMKESFGEEGYRAWDKETDAAHAETALACLATTCR